MEQTCGQGQQSRFGRAAEGSSGASAFIVAEFPTPNVALNLKNKITSIGGIELQSSNLCNLHFYFV